MTSIFILVNENFDDDDDDDEWETDSARVACDISDTDPPEKISKKANQVADFLTNKLKSESPLLLHHIQACYSEPRSIETQLDAFKDIFILKTSIH